MDAIDHAPRLHPRERPQGHGFPFSRSPMASSSGSPADLPADAAADTCEQKLGVTLALTA
jgi:hypothetical protein